MVPPLEEEADVFVLARSHGTGPVHSVDLPDLKDTESIGPGSVNLAVVRS